jgi:hypothetical protein
MYRFVLSFHLCPTNHRRVTDSFKVELYSSIDLNAVDRTQTIFFTINTGCNMVLRSHKILVAIRIFHFALFQIILASMEKTLSLEA